MRKFLVLMAILPVVASARIQSEADIIAGNYRVGLYLLESMCSNGKKSKLMRGVSYSTLTLFRSGTYRSQSVLKTKSGCTVDEVGEYKRISDSTQLIMEPKHKVLRCESLKIAKPLKLSEKTVVDIDETEEEITIAYINNKNDRYCPRGEFMINNFVIYNDQNP